MGCEMGPDEKVAQREMRDREHLDRLARDFGLPVMYDVPTIYDSLSNASSGIHLPMAWDERVYWIGMHELGHMAANPPHAAVDWLARWGLGDVILDQESEASLYAIYHSWRPLDNLWRISSVWGLGSYLTEFSYAAKVASRFQELIQAVGTVPPLAEFERFDSQWGPDVRARWMEAVNAQA